MPKVIEPAKRLELRSAWADCIDEFLKYLRWTPSQLATKLRVPDSTVSRWRSRKEGQGALPSQAAVQLLTLLMEEKGFVRKRDTSQGPHA